MRSVGLALGMLAVGCSSATRSGAAPSHADASRVEDARVDQADRADHAAAKAVDARADSPLDASSADAADAGAPMCDQSIVDGTHPPATTSFITPRTPVTPFFQWENNAGYCGEVSILQGALANGQWASQFNVRLLCGAAGNGLDAPVGTPLLQSGPTGFCAMSQGAPDYNAQVLLEQGASAWAARCAASFGLHAVTYPTASNAGMAGYEDYLSWVKGQVIAGNVVMIGVLVRDLTDSQYDHIPTVLRIGTNHDPTDSAYYPDDVLYFDDHGVYAFQGSGLAYNQPLPPGTGADTTGCTPFVFGYSFASLAATRAEANAAGAQGYSIVVPGVAGSATETGGNGTGDGAPVTGHDYAVAITGTDATDPTFPVTMRIAGSSADGAPNPDVPVAGYNYEDPIIGSPGLGDSCTNDPPSSWMTMTFDVTVSGLTAGESYVLYEYDTQSVSGVGSAAALAVPTASFNANRAMASAATPFTATGSTYATTLTRTSDVTVVLRAVSSAAP